jgi:hypothetical protein
MNLFDARLFDYRLDIVLADSSAGEDFDPVTRITY